MSNDRPDDVDAEFARLVADYDTPPEPPAEGLVQGRPWPASEDVDETDDAAERPESSESDEPEITIGGGGLAVSETDPLNTEATWEDEGHFVPPPPPPLPRLEPLTLAAWVGVIGSVLIAVLAALVGWAIPQLMLGAMIVGFVGGVVTLIARISRDPPDPNNPDDCAVV